MTPEPQPVFFFIEPGRSWCVWDSKDAKAAFYAYLRSKARVSQ